MNTQRFSIHIAALKSGVSEFLIRAWEKRYGAIEPKRTGSNQRRYSLTDIEKLTKLRHLLESGYRIGDIAGLASEDLDRLLIEAGGQSVAGTGMHDEISNGPVPRRKDALPEDSGFAGSRVSDGIPEDSMVIDQALDLIGDMNESGLEELLSRASISMTVPELLDRVMLPLTRRVGDKWHSGELRISQEHMATWVIKTILSGLLRAHRHQGSAPMMLVTTPAGQRHEIGALAVAISGAHCGWNVTYAGPDLPAEEIAAMALKTGAQLVALSLVYPPDDPHIPDEMSRLVHLLPDSVAFVAGGSAVMAYRQVMDRHGVSVLGSLQEFREYLDRFRRVRLQSVK